MGYVAKLLFGIWLTIQIIIGIAGFTWSIKAELSPWTNKDVLMPGYKIGLWLGHELHAAGKVKQFSSWLDEEAFFEE